MLFVAIKAMSVCHWWLSVTLANRLEVGLVVGLGLVQLLQSSFVDFPINNIRT